MTDCAPLTQCLACGGDQLQPYFDLGEMPLANDFRPDDSEPPTRYPLGLQVCTNCFHSQLTFGVDPAILFRNYRYVSGTSETLKEYFKGFVEKTTQGRKKLRVLEIGGNDGTLARMYAALGHHVYNVDPVAEGGDGVVAVRAFWRAYDAHLLSLIGQFDIIVLMNVLPHVESPVETLAMAASVLKRDGRIYVQTSQAQWLINCEFDTVYHEHRSHFMASSFFALAQRVHLKIVHIEYASIHGKSYLVTLEHHGIEDFSKVVRGDLPTPNVMHPLVMHEERFGYRSLQMHERFAALAEHIKQQAVHILHYHLGLGRRLVGVGAAAKGMVFLNYTGIRPVVIVDDNPKKQFTLAPVVGVNIPVLPFDKAGLDDPTPAIFLILAWNFKEELIAKIRAIRPDGDDLFMFCRYPEVTVER